MALLRWIAPSLLLVGGCVIIFDADDLRQPPPDASPVDSMPVPDADPDLLALISVTPTTVLEGAGQAGARPALIEIRGMQIDNSVTLTVTPAGVTVVDHWVAPDHNSMVVALSVPISAELADGESDTLTITASQGTVSKSIDVGVTGLDELEPAAGALNVSTLKPLYSRASFAANVHFTGDRPARIVTVADITVAAVLDVDASGQTPGPGGCAGGAAGDGGGCGAGGGGAASGLSASGGGGGFGDVGEAGSGLLSERGDGGDATGDEMLPVLEYNDTSTPGNRGNGGGGGAGLSNGIGGGGGGTLELTAGGSFKVESAGVLRSAGGASTGGNGGGGGAGGAILVRAYAGLTARDGWITAPGYQKSGGGAGGKGRVRIDAPSGDIPDMSDPAAARGPSWDPATAVAVRDGRPTFTARGKANARHALVVNGNDAGAVLLDDAGTKSVAVTLTAGLNELCLLAKETGASVRENKNCITVAYVPPP